MISPKRTMTVAEYREAVKKSPRKTAGKTNNHTVLVKAIVERLNLVLFVDALPMNTGEIHREGIHVKYGFPGMADVMVRTVEKYFPPWRTIWLEVKTGTGKPSKVQLLFKEMVERWGDKYIVCRSIDDAVKAIRGEKD